MKYETFLKKNGLAPSTIKLYVRINRTIPKRGAIEWLETQISERRPISTLMVKRSCIKFRIMMKGYSEEEAMNLLPKIKGIKSVQRAGLSGRQLKRYNIVVSKIKEPFRTILLLLPLTGFRINEICTLQKKNIVQVEDRWVVKIVGKGEKPRTIPLGSKAQKLLQHFIKTYQPSKWIFEGRKDFIKPTSVRAWTSRIGKNNPELQGISPHVLRHTFATILYKKDVSPMTIQMLMGHNDLKTTQRYIHPTLDDLFKGIDTI